jgi:hypothetical protein
MMKIEKIFPWSPELDQGLSETFAGDYAEIVQGVNARQLEAYRMWDGAAYMVTRVEKGVLTCCCYQGSRLVEAMDWMRARSSQLGLTDIVFFTKRPALQRLLRKFDFQLDAQVFRARVA